MLSEDQAKLIEDCALRWVSRAVRARENEFSGASHQSVSRLWGKEKQARQEFYTALQFVKSE